MLTIFSTVFGFLAPFVPQLFKLWQTKIDYAQEREMLALRMKYAEHEHLWRIGEIEAKADIAEMQTLRSPQTSFGVQMLDAARGSGLGKWALVPAFYLFTLLDWFSGMVRPIITYAMVAFYMAVKWAQYDAAMQVVGAVGALTEIWSENDWAVLMLVLSYWFGSRTAKSVFGGSASTGKAGA